MNVKSAVQKIKEMIIFCAADFLYITKRVAGHGVNSNLIAGKKQD